MKYQCIICGVPFVDGVGFTEPHRGLCANARYGWNFTKDVPETDEERKAVADEQAKALADLDSWGIKL